MRVRRVEAIGVCGVLVAAFALQACSSDSLEGVRSRGDTTMATKSSATTATREFPEQWEPESADEATFFRTLEGHGYLDAWDGFGFKASTLRFLLDDMCSEMRRTGDYADVDVRTRDRLTQGLTGPEQRRMEEVFAFTVGAGLMTYCPDVGTAFAREIQRELDRRT